MSLQRLVLYALVTVLAVPSSALAQDDDLLAPPTPSKSRSKSGKPPGKTKVVKKKPARVTKKPAGKSKAPAKSRTAKKPPVADPIEDDLLAPPTLKKTELLVRISGSVRGAKLLVDGKDAGTLTAAPIPVEVAPGEHLLVVRKPGYAEYTKRVDVKEGAQQELTVSLDATMGFATLTADVAGVVAFVDGQEVGPVPQGNVLLKPGSREIEFRAPGFKPDVHNITVFAGRSYDVTGTMRPSIDTSVAASDPGRSKPSVTEPTIPQDTSPGLDIGAEAPPEVSSGKPWYGRWYVWAGVGAVVAAGTVGAVMATQGGTPDPLDPTAVCGGVTCDAILGNGARPVRGGSGGRLLPLQAGALRF
ncbi:PEGA domain-containing protein [Pyxidicoccus xibeiensis]|uniref:PEGA domain-containing protein n=1 Tax=Pyxidicoccus xibeiensis TaxID=2906759 RepID=UPI0020A7EF29|nr:PEGA domain-containing protein [Pyxidicoccus xibeiensis]MCP3144038.1 PEGA domain-containing protein [Pyxidicoccus xibeiensis]